MASAYAFANDMLRDVVYTEAGDARRRLFHRRALAVLEAARDSAAVLAHHALDAGPQPDRRESVAALKDVFEDPAIEKVGHDLKREVMALVVRGMRNNLVLFSRLDDVYPL